MAWGAVQTSLLVFFGMMAVVVLTRLWGLEAVDVASECIFERVVIMI